MEFSMALQPGTVVKSPQRTLPYRKSARSGRLWHHLLSHDTSNGVACCQRTAKEQDGDDEGGIEGVFHGKQ